MSNCDAFVWTYEPAGGLILNDATL